MIIDQEKLAEEIINYAKRNKEHAFNFDDLISSRKKQGRSDDEQLVKTALEKLYTKGLLFKINAGYDSHMTDYAYQWTSFEDERNQKRNEQFKKTFVSNFVYPAIVAISIVIILYFIYRIQ